MNDPKRGLARAAAATFLFSIALFLLRMVVIWRDVDSATGLFRQPTSFLCGVYNGVGAVLLGVYFLAALVLYARSKKTPAAPVQDPDAELSEALDRFDHVFSEEEEEEKVDDPVPGAVRDAATWNGTLSAFSYFLPGFGFLFFALSFLLQGKMDLLTVLFCLLSAASGVFFLLSGTLNRSKRHGQLAFFGLIPALWATLRMVIEYRDVEKFINRGLYTGNLLFLIAAVGFFIYQAQMILGEENYAQPQSWAATALLVILFGLSARLPQLLGLFLDRLGTMDLRDAASLLLDLSLTLFAGMKVVKMLR